MIGMMTIRQRHQQVVSVVVLVVIIKRKTIFGAHRRPTMTGTKVLVLVVRLRRLRQRNRFRAVLLEAAVGQILHLQVTVA